MRARYAVLRLVRNGHDHPGFIACVTALTRDRVELELHRLRAGGLVSKRRGRSSWYLRPPWKRRNHSKGGDVQWQEKKARARAAVNRSRTSAAAAQPASGLKRSASQQPRKANMATANRKTATKRRSQQQSQTGTRNSQMGAGTKKTTRKTTARKTRGT